MRAFFRQHWPAIIFVAAFLICAVVVSWLPAQEPVRHPTYLWFLCAKTCPPCAQMKAAIANSSDLKASVAKFGVWHFDHDNPKHLKAFADAGVKEMPTVVIYDQHKGEIDRLVGYPDKGGDERLSKFLSGTCGLCAGRGVVPINDQGRYNWSRCDRCGGKGHWKAKS